MEGKLNVHVCVRNVNLTWNEVENIVNERQNFRLKSFLQNTIYFSKDSISYWCSFFCNNDAQVTDAVEYNVKLL